MTFYYEQEGITIVRRRIASVANNGSRGMGNSNFSKRYRFQIGFEACTMCPDNIKTNTKCCRRNADTVCIEVTVCWCR